MALVMGAIRVLRKRCVAMAMNARACNVGGGAVTASLLQSWHAYLCYSKTW